MKIKINEINEFLSKIKKFPYLKTKSSKGNFFFPLEKQLEETNGDFILTKKISNNIIENTPGILLKYDAEKDETKGVFAYANLSYSSEVDLSFYLAIFGKEKLASKIPFECYLVSEDYILGKFDFKKD